MQTNLPTYTHYKPSGVQWLGDIPEHWEVKRVKNVCNINQDSLPENTTKDFSFEYVDIGSVIFEKGITQTEQFIFKNAPSRARRIAKYGDTIISTVRTYLKAIDYIDKLKSQYIYSTGFAVLNPYKIHPNFLAIAVKSDAFTNQVDAFSTGMSYPAINSTELSRLSIPIPPLPEQTAIAQFLDRKTALIDKAIGLKEKQIELLKERRQILIHQAVTRGLNPDVPMKDSGVQWIGEIPEHWEILKVKNVFQLIIDPAPKNNGQELLSVYTDIGVKPRAELEERGNKASTTDGYWIVKKGDIVVNKLLAWMGAIGISDYDGVTSPAYDILRAKRPIEGYFYHNLFRTPICISELRKHSRGIMDMRLRLYFDKFGDVRIPYPPRKEQTEIVTYIESTTKKIDTAIGLKEQEIEKLKEYKASLINSVVTGKVKVTAPPEE